MIWVVVRRKVKVHRLWRGDVMTKANKAVRWDEKTLSVEAGDGSVSQSIRLAFESEAELINAERVCSLQNSTNETRSLLREKNVL